MIKTFESFFKKKTPIETVKHLNDLNSDELESILSIESYNDWLSNDCTSYGGYKGAPGIVGRIDKLSLSFIEEYFKFKKIIASDEDMQTFLETIRKNWRSTQ